MLQEPWDAPLTPDVRHVIEQSAHRAGWLAGIRQAAGLTQAELANANAQATISRLENSPLGARQLDTIATYLDALGYDLHLTATHRPAGETFDCPVTPPRDQQ